MMFVDCPAYLDEDGAARCGLPAEVRCRYIMRSTDGPLEGAMIRCPAGHWFNGPIESLTRERADNHDSGAAAPVPEQGGTARRAPMMAVTVGAGLPSVTTPPSRSGRAVARTPRLPTIWGGPPACGSPACARAAGTPHPATWTNQSPAGHERRPGTEAPSPAPGPRQPVRRLPSVLVSRRGQIVMAATDRGHAVITEASSGIGAAAPASARPACPCPRWTRRCGHRLPCRTGPWSASPRSMTLPPSRATTTPHGGSHRPACMRWPAVLHPHPGRQRLEPRALHDPAQAACPRSSPPPARAPSAHVRPAGSGIQAAPARCPARPPGCARHPEHDSGPHDAGAQRNRTERTRSMKPVLHRRQAGGRR
jgi:hypothetical protein